MILIFGAGGQVGQELQRAAFGKGVACRALSHAEVDIADAADVARAFDETRPTLVVNAAAYTKVDLAETEVDAAQRANEIGPGVVGKACAARETPLIHISTDYVFDGTKTGPYVESDPLAPLGVYGRTKAAGEAAARDAAPRHVILRTSWVYGEFGNNFLKTMLRLARDRDELRVVADQHGCPTSTRDIAAAILRIAPRLETSSDLYGLYHFAGVGATNWHGFASRIVEAQANITGRRPTVAAITTADYPTPARRPANSVLDCSLFEKSFGFSAHNWGEETDAVAKALASKG
ncbi:dTDP-4-dehydrorhamnose reductase [Methylocella silvestris BL2]|uniref:dTDP-4-dehydrorhamnose reductase n=1 Tax=Methylocella silvestris (strain DSM 15510 / CIP 108128 / LMG 27833 / NCIMB 13906 / BL2) TaxID=395965 RepID=B8ERT6_METSB|nr:dTDP-4-dehydrorhamnose reductase [Methylocella silvestris]ACK51634.1 dTDP-4-dehydrorhamnose reductase [Methylocella silvestris BL2]